MTTPELVFAIANNGVLPFWGLLILFPRWRGTRVAVHSVVPGLLLGGLYGLGSRVHVLLAALEGPGQEQAREGLAFLANVLVAGDEAREVPWHPSEALDEVLRLIERGLLRLTEREGADGAVLLGRWGVVGAFRCGAGE